MAFLGKTQFRQKQKKKAVALLLKYGGDILQSENMQKEKGFIQHGKISCYAHSVSVACLSIQLALFFRLSVDFRSLVRGALLHDYFLYDWHKPDKSHRLHGFIHAGRALENAKRDFLLNEIEEDIIGKHMFPLNPTPPKYRESILVTCADKLCAASETFLR